MEQLLLQERLERAAEAIAQAEALLIAAGAGMGVDSGLPDFRGNEGFWKAYPPFRERNLSFFDLANPHWFDVDPEQAWGFYGHRLNLYREIKPHAGFAWLKRWGERVPAGSFVFTSNVDGHFQKAGMPENRILECHGSLHHLQCSVACTRDTWDAAGTFIDVDPGSIRARPPLPTCPRCGQIARPNVLMFDDGRWISDRARGQHRRYLEWLASARQKRFVIIECGAGKAVPTVRRECEASGGLLIRINLREPEVPRGGISLQLPAAEALLQIAERLDLPPTFGE